MLIALRLLSCLEGFVPHRSHKYKPRLSLFYIFVLMFEVYLFCVGAGSTVDARIMNTA